MVGLDDYNLQRYLEDFSYESVNHTSLFTYWEEVNFACLNKGLI